MSHGSFGIVYKAREKNEVFAVKVVLQDKAFVSLMSATIALRSEIILQSSLDHANIIKVKKVSPMPLAGFFDFCDSGSMYAFFHKTPQKPIDGFLALAFLIDIASALEYIHGANHFLPCSFASYMCMILFLRVICLNRNADADRALRH